MVRDAQMIAAVHETGRLVRPVISRMLRYRTVWRWDRAWPVRLHRLARLTVCPVQGPHAFYDTFGAPRTGGRRHQGNDLFAPQWTPVVAAQSGMVVRYPNGLGGRALHVFSRGSYTYYAHLSRYVGGKRWVRAGTIIGYVGHSGDARVTPYHLHFEYHPGRGAAVDPFPLLQRVC